MDVAGRSDRGTWRRLKKAVKTTITNATRKLDSSSSPRIFFNICVDVGR